MAYIYDGILESHEAREIAEENKKNHGIEQTEEDAAKEWFLAVIYNGEGNFGLVPTFHQFVDSIDDEWDLYYDYGADYYFAVNDNMEERISINLKHYNYDKRKENDKEGRLTENFLLS